MVIRIGTSGWSYDHWHPELYPPGLPAGDRLARHAATFPAAELNSSFYRWPRPATFSSWRDGLPDGFRLSVKAPRGLTHARKLYAPEGWLQRIAAGWHELGDKRAVLLVQLPPSLPRDDARLAYFLRMVPGWMRVAVEFRHRSWHCEEIFAVLEAHRAGYCVVSGAELPRGNPRAAARIGTSEWWLPADAGASTATSTRRRAGLSRTSAPGRVARGIALPGHPTSGPLI